MKKHIVVLTGAGISAESGVKTFRETGGLWEGHDVMQVASPQGFRNNPELVLDFYNQRRRQLKEVRPNAAHVALAQLEKEYQISIVTQNVDDLHERAGSTNVLHLHGELRKVRSTGNLSDIKVWEDDIYLGDLCNNGYQLRPHIVWFGEDVPTIEKAVSICEKADILVIIGTSMQVYPAANLMNFVDFEIPIYYIDPNPAVMGNKKVTVIRETATLGMKKLMTYL
ncbi:NAD-dependent deacylase [Winogradskyella sp.]|uniref:SIR2 family NAD-dependent protein deacylase n=1 Tax=Winogradskyella sp. TaxID=1883156 RepID=UPI0025E4976B|nr:NAD-dependent deacylase [Winogradskyella sp.]MBT8243942.1 NAD-dependent deacylase [Winogradskyella sp.]